MGWDKALIELCGRRLIDIVVGRLRLLTEQVLVVARDGHALGEVEAEVIEDDTPFAGPLPALAAGLRAAGADRAVVVACDMPFLRVDLLRELARLVGGWDAAVPVTPRGPEPLHAAYASSAIRGLDAALAAGVRSLRGALACLRLRLVEEAEWRPMDPEGRSFINLNTREEFEAARASIESRAGQG